MRAIFQGMSGLFKPLVADWPEMSPVALREAEWIIRGMLKERPDILEGLAQTKTRFAVMAVEER